MMSHQYLQEKHIYVQYSSKTEYGRTTSTAEHKRSSLTSISSEVEVPLVKMAIYLFLLLF